MLNQYKWTVALSAILLIIAFSGCKKEPRLPVGSIKVGYDAEDILQLPIVEAMRRSDIPEEYLVEISLDPISLEKLTDNASVNVAFLPMTSAIELLDANDRWFIAGRLVNHRVMLYSPLDAPIETFTQLNGKRVAITSGSQAHRLLLENLELEGFSVGTEVRLSNRSSEDLLQLASHESREDWGDFDAFAANLRELVSFEIDREIHFEKIGVLPTLILIDRNFARQNEIVVDHFLAALLESYLFVAHNFGTTVSWSKQSLPLDIDSTVVWRTGVMEPNFRAMLKGHINLNLPAPQIENIQKAVDFMFEKETITKAYSVTQFLDLNYLRRGERLYWDNRGYEPSFMTHEP